MVSSVKSACCRLDGRRLITEHGANEDMTHLPVSHQVNDSDVHIYMEPSNGVNMNHKEQLYSMVRYSTVTALLIH